jgi:hypothetical protein
MPTAMLVKLGWLQSLSSSTQMVRLLGGMVEMFNEPQVGLEIPQMVGLIQLLLTDYEVRPTVMDLAQVEQFRTNL